VDLPTTYMSTVITWLSYAILLSGIYLLYRIVTELGEIKELLKGGQRPGELSALPLADSSTQLGHDVDSYADNLLRQVQQNSSQNSPSSNQASQTVRPQLDHTLASAQTSLARLDRAIETGAPGTNNVTNHVTQDRDGSYGESIAPSANSDIAVDGDGQSNPWAGSEVAVAPEVDREDGHAVNETAGPGRFEAARAKAGRSFPGTYVGSGTSAGSPLATAGLPASLASALASTPVAGSGSSASGFASGTSSIRTAPAAAPLKSVALKAMEFVPSQARSYQPSSGSAESAMNTVGAIHLEGAATQTSLESAATATAVLELPTAELREAAAPQATHAPIESTLSQLAKASAEHIQQPSFQPAPVQPASLLAAPLSAAQNHRAEFVDLDLPSFLPHGRREDDWEDPAV